MRAGAFIAQGFTPKELTTHIIWDSAHADSQILHYFINNLKPSIYLFGIEIFQVILAALNVFQELRVTLEMEENRCSWEIQQALEIGRGGEVKAEGLQLDVGLDSQSWILSDTERAILNLKFLSDRIKVVLSWFGWSNIGPQSYEQF